MFTITQRRHGNCIGCVRRGSSFLCSLLLEKCSNDMRWLIICHNCIIDICPEKGYNAPTHPSRLYRKFEEEISKGSEGHTATYIKDHSQDVLFTIQHIQRPFNFCWGLMLTNAHLVVISLKPHSTVTLQGFILLLKSAISGVRGP